MKISVFGLKPFSQLIKEGFQKIISPFEGNITTGSLPPTPMPPQEEELEEGEYMDMATGKIKRRGEQFKVDPNDEPDDVKRQDTIGKSDWFNKLRK